MALEDSSSRMSRLGSAIANHGRVIPISESLAVVDAVSHDDVRRVATSIFTDDRVTSLVGPDSH